MARNVGAIEVTVDADTGRLTAQLRRAGTTGGRAYGSAFEEELGDISGRELLARLKVIRAKAEAELTNMDLEVGLDDREVRSGIKRLEARLKAAQLELLVDTDFDTGELEAELQTVRSLLRDLRLDVEFEIDAADVIALRQIVDSLLGEIEVKITPELDTSKLAAIRARLAAWGDDAGRDAGDGFGSGFGGVLGSRAGRWISGVAVLGDAIAVALQGGLAAGTAIISSAIGAIGAAALAATPLLFGFGAAITAIVVGSQGVGTALGAINDEFASAAAEGRKFSTDTKEINAALRNLSPSARATALAFADIRDELANSRLEVQEELFRGMSAAVSELGRTALPSVTDALKTAAREVNVFGRNLAQIANDTDFSGLADALAPALNASFRAAESLVRTIEPFLLAAAPAADRLAESFARGAEGLERWVTTNPDKLAQFLDDGLTSLDGWIELLKSTGDLLATIFQAGAASGDNFVVSLNNIIERWDGFLESAAGQTALEDFFAAGESAVAAFKPVLDGLKEAFDTLISPESSGNFDELLESIGGLIPVIAEVIAIIGQLQLAEAFSNLLQLLQPVLDLLSAIPAPLLEIVGTGIVVAASIMKIVAALKAVGLASSALTLTNPILLGIAAAVTVAVLAFEAFSGGADTAAQRTEELATALQNTVDSMVNSGEVAAGAAFGFKALNEAILETGEGGDKLQQSFATINSGAGDAQLGITDVTRVLTGLRDSGEQAQSMLEQLATGYGLSGSAAKEMATLVNETDNNMDTAADKASWLGLQMTNLAEETGLPRDALVELFGALEEMQDQAEDTDLQKIADEFNRIASTGTEAEQAMLAEAEATAKANGQAGDAVAVFDEFTRLLNASANAGEGAAEANTTLASSYSQIQQSIDEGLAAHRERAAALKAERAAAFESYEANKRLAEATKEAAGALAANMGVPREFADGLISIGESARNAADQASALSSALDLLLDPTLSVQEAFSNVQAGIDDLTASIETNGATLDLNTEAGRANAEQIRTNIGGLTDWAAAELAAGTAAGDVAAKVEYARQGLIGQAEAFFTTSEAAGTARQQAEAYISSLGLTPELVSTVIAQPGLVDALLNAQNLTLLYDAAGNPVITEFEAAGIDPAMASVEGFETLVQGLNTITGEPTIAAPTIPPVEGEVENLQGGVETLDGTTASPTVTMPTAAGIKSTIEGLQTQLRTLGATTATPTITMPSYSGIKSNIEGLQRALDTLGDTTAAPRVSAPGATGAKTDVDALDRAINGLSGKNVTVDANVTGKGEVDALKRAIDNLQSKTITVTTRNVTTTAGGMTGMVLPGAMAGELIHGPTRRAVGERGYAEAIVPLQLPLNRVDPSVREMAELLREGPRRALTPVPGKTVNNYMTITPLSADPEAVAAQVINRAAAMAN